MANIQLVDSTVESNRTTSDTGLGGGGILNFFNGVTVVNSKIEDNSAVNGAGIRLFGGGSNGNSQIRGSEIKNNEAGRLGGGLYIDAGLTVELSGSLLELNQASHATENTTAGGIYNGGDLIVSRSKISTNTADFAGGIFNFGTATISDSTISVNDAKIRGGGVYNFGDASVVGTMTIRSTGIDRNFSQDIAGVYNQGHLTIERSSVTNNLATGHTGGLSSGGDFAELTLDNSTISTNFANDNVGGLGIWGGTATVQHVTIANNRADNDDIGNHGNGGVWVGQTASARSRCAPTPTRRRTPRWPASSVFPPW